MPSKAVTDRQKSSLAVQAAARTHGTEIGQALRRELGPYLSGGESAPDGELLCSLLARQLESVTQRMVQRDEAHADELFDDANPRLRRDAAAERLGEALVSIRSTVRGLFGAKAEAAVLGARGPTSADPLVLLRQADTALSRLREPGLELPPPKLGGVVVDPAGWASLLEAPASELRAALEDVAREAREAERSLGEKNAALDAYDQAFGGAAELLQALLRFAGRDDLADRVRPSTRRPGQTEENAPQEPASPAPEGI